MIKEIKSIGENAGYTKLSLSGGGKKDYDFKNFKTLRNLIKDLYNRNMTIEKVERKQYEFAKKT